MDEKELRAEVQRISDELHRLLSEAWRMFRTSGWIKTADELPPVGVMVLVREVYATGPSFAENHGWTGHGGREPESQIVDWYHYQARGTFQNTVPPEYWMAIPPEPR